MTGKKRVLDSFAILALLQNEPGAARVAAALAESRSGGARAAMSEINAGEVYYCLRRAASKARADELWAAFLALDLELVPADLDLVLAAARVKGERKLAYADCFAVATAQRLGASVLTGDPGFRAVTDLVNVEWVR
ncbi:MAG: type II toxin-antitoxin system VapC family toxin [Planctomycetales bacterium]|nr:type II toxin-antitoxin system VapC family toxin [Planctomycetales bacterium]